MVHNSLIWQKRGRNGTKLLLFIDKRADKLDYGIKKVSFIYLSKRIHDDNCNHDYGKV